MAANSTFESDSDLAKHEKARKLKDYIVLCTVFLLGDVLPLPIDAPRIHRLL